MNFIKKIYYFLKGNKLTKLNIRLTKKWIGTYYGGFYIHLDKVNKDSIIYSLGIGEDASFDLSLMELKNCKVYGFDPTPKSISWVKDNVKSKNFIFSPIGISSDEGKKKFFLPKNINHVSGSLLPSKVVDESNYLTLDFKSLKTIMNENNHKKIDILKMDVEGAEFEIINQIYSENLNINQILVEFHSNLIVDGKSKTKDAILTLEKMGYKCFGISKTFQEYSFIKT